MPRSAGITALMAKGLPQARPTRCDNVNEMPETAPKPPLSIEDEDTDAWSRALDALGEDLGYAEALGPRHRAIFSDEGTTLLVTFESGPDVREHAPGRVPVGLTMARARGWSHLGLLAEGDTWWRDPAVWRYFDRLVDDAFFEGFDRVLFFGAGPGGYAAAAYSVAAPGANVLAIQPQATLLPALAGWDGRFPAARRLDFSTRYAFAPDMTEGAGRAWIIFDPTEREDAMHAALFHRPWTTLLPARRLGGTLRDTLAGMGVLAGLVGAAMDGSLDRLAFARALRARRDHGAYLRRLLLLAQADGRTAREIRICRSVVGRMRAPMFRRRLAELMGEPVAGG